MTAGAFRLRRHPRGEVAHVVVGRGTFAICGVSGVTVERGTVTRLCVKCRAWLERQESGAHNQPRQEERVA